jgi:hypothetical protein
MYIRKTRDLYIIQGFYSGSWEDETTEYIRREAINRLLEYRENMPEYAHRLTKKREKRDLYRSGGKIFETLEDAKQYANFIHAKNGVILGIEKI